MAANPYLLKPGAGNGPERMGKMKTAMATTAWILGLCMAGADGPIFINLIGLGVFMLSSMAIVKEAVNG